MENSGLRVLDCVISGEEFYGHNAWHLLTLGPLFSKGNWDSSPLSWILGEDLLHKWSMMRNRKSSKAFSFVRKQEWKEDTQSRVPGNRKNKKSRMIMENERRSEGKRDCRMPQREHHPQRTELRTAWPSFTQQLSKPISFLLSEHHGQPHPTHWLLANVGAPKPSLTLLKFLMACLPIRSVMDHHREDPKIGQLSANCLSAQVEMNTRQWSGSWPFSEDC